MMDDDNDTYNDDINYIGDMPIFFKELFKEIDTNSDGELSNEEIKKAYQTPEIRSQLEKLIVKNESEWHQGGRVQALYESFLNLFKTEEQRNVVNHEMTRIKELEFMSKVPMPSKVWHMNPLSFANQLKNNKTNLLFPLHKRPEESYKDEPRKFNSNRSNGRKHAGIDLYAPSGTDILAISDGKVLRFAYFYLNTYVLEIDHGDFIVRYGEISDVVGNLKEGDTVYQGQTIAKVGKLVFPSGTVMSMLHLEMYSKEAEGALTNRNNPPYLRRKDLVDPTPFLDISKTGNEL